jgi:hypothetical protein
MLQLFQMDCGTQQKQQKNLNKKSLKILLGIVFLVKLLAVFAGSFPFDFATYVYQGRSYFEYGIPALFYWNKGMPLLGIFYGQYSAYQFIINHLFGGTENTLLMHIVFKLPLFALDVVCALYIKKILKIVTHKDSIAKLGLIFWTLNPFLLWSIEFQGSYAIIAACFSVISIYYLLKDKTFLSILFLVASASVYYYTLIFLPFYLLKNIAQAKNITYADTFKTMAYFVGLLLLFYLPYFFNITFAKSLIASLLNHSAPNSSPYTSAIQLPNYSILKIPYYLIYHHFPTNLTSPRIFLLAKLLTFVSLFLIAIIALVRFFKLRKYKYYSDMSLLKDLTIITAIFLVFVGGFQDHYITLLMPLIILVGFAAEYVDVLICISYISFVTLLLILSSGNLGIYLLDILPFGIINIFIPLEDYTQALAGFTVIVLFIGIVLSIIFKKNGKGHLNLIKPLLLLSIMFYAFIGVISFISIVDSLALHSNRILGADTGAYNFVYKPNNIKIESSHGTFKNASLGIDDFKVEPDEALRSGLNRQANSTWVLYNIRGGSNNTASFSDVNGSNTLSLSPDISGSTFQVNLGGSKSKNLIPIRRLAFYNISTKVSFIGVQSKDLRVSIRYADINKKIIPASDLILKLLPTHQKNTFIYSTNFIVPDNAYYLEPLYTLTTAKNNTNTPQRIEISNLNLTNPQYYQTFTYKDIKAASNNNQINSYIVSKPSNKYFMIHFTVKQNSEIEKIASATLNDCRPISDNLINHYFLIDFKANCLNSPSNQLRLTTINYPAPVYQISLVHSTSSIHTVRYNKPLFFVLSIFGILMFLVSFFALIFIIWKKLL